MVKEFWKSVHICQSSYQHQVASFFETQCTFCKCLCVCVHVWFVHVWLCAYCTSHGAVVSSIGHCRVCRMSSTTSSLKLDHQLDRCRSTWRRCRRKPSCRQACRLVQLPSATLRSPAVLVLQRRHPCPASSSTATRQRRPTPAGHGRYSALVGRVRRTYHRRHLLTTRPTLLLLMVVRLGQWCRRHRSATRHTLLQRRTSQLTVWTNVIASFTVNPLECRGSYSATSNDVKLVHWPLMGALLHLVQWAVSRELGGRSPPRPLLAVPNITAHPPTASVSITVLLYNGKGKGKCIYLALFCSTSHSRRSGMDHSFTCKLHQCLPLPRKRSPDGACTD